MAIATRELTKRERFHNREQLATWLRWANPDDGWHIGEFPELSGVQSALAQLVAAEAFGEDTADLAEFCVETLATLTLESAWPATVTVGFTDGEDPANFFRSACRVNPQQVIRKLTLEYEKGEEVSRRIPPPL